MKSKQERPFQCRVDQEVTAKNKGNPCIYVHFYPLKWVDISCYFLKAYAEKKDNFIFFVCFGKSRGNR